MQSCRMLPANCLTRPVASLMAAVLELHTASAEAAELLLLLQREAPVELAHTILERPCYRNRATVGGDTSVPEAWCVKDAESTHSSV
jgi:hypothetical protein